MQVGTQPSSSHVLFSKQTDVFSISEILIAVGIILIVFG